MLVQHGHNMRMCVRDMNSGIEQGDALHLVEALHGAGYLLRTGGNTCGQRFGQVFEPDMMRLGDDQRMALADRVQIQKGKDMIIFIQLESRQIAARDPAEQTVFHETPRLVTILYLAQAGLRGNHTRGLQGGCRAAKRTHVPCGTEKRKPHDPDTQ